MLRKMVSSNVELEGNTRVGVDAAERLRAKDCSLPSRSHSPRYITSVKGKRLNCLSSFHKRADCKRSRRSLAALGHTQACTMDAGKCVIRPAMTFLVLVLPHKQCMTLSCPLGMEAPPMLWRWHPLLLVASPCLSLISVSSVCFTPRSWDPMVEEAALGATVGALFHSY
jgi:hypothetical protein